MGCTKIGHRHVWPTEGLLVIQRCEQRCNFCTGPAAKKEWKYAWFLRRHVRAVHVGRKGKGQYPKLIVDDSWDDSKLQHMQMNHLRDSKSGKVKWIEQPEFEEQIRGGALHAGNYQYIKQEPGSDIDNFNGGFGDFIDNPNGTYPAFADEDAAATTSNPFTYDEVSAFLHEVTVGQTEFEPTDPEEEPLPGEADEDSIQVANSGPTFTYPSDTPDSDPFAFEPDYAAGSRFFMDIPDYGPLSDGSFDSFDDQPLSQVTNQYPSQPDFVNYGRLLPMLDSDGEQMSDEDLDPTDMTANFAMFARGLISRNENRTPVNEGGDVEMS